MITLTQNETVQLRACNEQEALAQHQRFQSASNPLESVPSSLLSAIFEYTDGAPDLFNTSRINKTTSTMISNMPFVELQRHNTPFMKVKPHATQLYIETSEFRQQLQAWSNSTTESMRSKLALSPSWPIRHITAKHSLTPASVLAKLAYDQNYFIRNAVAANHNTLPEQLLFLAQDQLAAETVAKNPCTPVEFLIQWQSLRHHVALNEAIPQTQLHEWAVDPSQSMATQQALATNPQTPIIALEHLFENANMYVQLAKNQKLPLHLLHTLADQNNLWVLTAIAANKQTPPYILADLAHQPLTDIRRNIAKNPNTDSHILSQLANDADNLVRISALSNPNISLRALEIEANTCSSQKREAIAQNSNTPTHILAGLAQDKDSSVRLAIAENPSTPAHILATMVRQESERSVLCALARHKVIQHIYR